jgi:CheY-like chemotaxis protein
MDSDTCSLSADIHPFQSPRQECPAPAAIQAAGARAGEAYGLPAARILLAGSSEIDQFMVREILARAGYDCHSVCDGRAAFDVLLDDEFDLVLLECQTPQGHGLETVRAIRGHEADSDPDGQCEPLLIVALIGNPTHNERHRCLTAGVDACVPLPIDPGQLVGAIDGLLSVRRRDRIDCQPQCPEPAQSSPFDLEALLHRCWGDHDFSARILRKFAVRADGQRSALWRAAASGNLVELGREAHSLKGVAANLSADELRARAARLELAAKSRATDCLAPLLAETCDELARCVASIPHVLDRLQQGI